MPPLVLLAVLRISVIHLLCGVWHISKLNVERQFYCATGTQVDSVRQKEGLAGGKTRGKEDRCVVNVL